MKTISSILVLGTAILAGCGNQPAETEQAAGVKSGGTPEVTLPATLFLNDAPSGAGTLNVVRSGAKAGDTVVFTGYVGGRAEPFTEGRALFLVADSENAPMCGDECRTSWDACCTPGDQIAVNIATVRVVDESGEVMKIGLNGTGMMSPGAAVTIAGEVHEASDAVFLVDASGIHVGEAVR